MIEYSALLVAIGGFMGAIARFAINKWFNERYSSSFPIATLLINLIGAFLLGYIIGRDLSVNWELLLGTGFMGAFTTFSTFKLEAIKLHMVKNWRAFALYLGISYTLGILLAFLGMRLGGMI